MTGTGTDGGFPVLPLRDDFEHRTGPFRREILAHCYRMLGSVHDAEDLLQETMLRAWRAADGYDPARASVRTWLYRISTNACLTALDGRAHRPLPMGFVGRSDDPEAALVARPEIPWLQPFPDAAADPAAAAVARDSLRLALIAALQTLPPRQRAVLILRDVVDWPAAEVASALGLSVPAVNSALQRARARLRATSPTEDSVQAGSPTDAAQQRATVDSFVTAFERADVPALVALLARDVVLEMPPVLNWYTGRDHYGRFMNRVFAMRGVHWRAFPIAANGQPALAAYARAADGRYAAHSLQVLEVDAGLIRHNVVFADPSLFSAFGLASVVTAHAGSADIRSGSADIRSGSADIRHGVGDELPAAGR